MTTGASNRIIIFVIFCRSVQPWAGSVSAAQRPGNTTPRNIAEVASGWRHCVLFDGLGIEPQTFCTVCYVFNHYAYRPILSHHDRRVKANLTEGNAIAKEGLDNKSKLNDIFVFFQRQFSKDA